jgi:hypothetical protein
MSNKSSLLRTVSNRSSLLRTVSHKIPAYPLLAGGEETDVTGGHCSGKYPGLGGNGGRGAFHKGTAFPGSDTIKLLLLKISNLMRELASYF